MPDDNNISSAEMTAYWRSLHPSVSNDNISQYLASPAGIEKAKQFEKQFNYPLVGRKVSVRAGFFLREAVEALKTGEYDACISLGSGLSLLPLLIKQQLPQKLAEEVTFYDTDLPYMIEMREKRIAELKSLETDIDFSSLAQIKLLSIDLEAASKENRTLREVFPNAKKPFFLVEGIIYFLSEACNQWIYNQINSFAHAGIVLDYWPDNAPLRSKCFRDFFEKLRATNGDYMPEKIQSFFRQPDTTMYQTSFTFFKDIPIEDVEAARVSPEDSKQLTNSDEFFAIQLMSARK